MLTVSVSISHQTSIGVYSVPELRNAILTKSGDHSNTNRIIDPDDKGVLLNLAGPPVGTFTNLAYSQLLDQGFVLESLISVPPPQGKLVVQQLGVVFFIYSQPQPGSALVAAPRTYLGISSLLLYS